MRARPILLLPIAALLVLSSVRPLHAAWPHDVGTHLHIAPSSFAQSQPRVAPDGAGGFFITWQEQSGGTGIDVYAQHVTATGAIAAGWPAGGIALYAGSSDQTDPTVLSDGVGGAYFAWADKRSGGVQGDIYVTRLASDGNIPSGWVAGGIAAQFDSKDEYLPQLVSDGSGGVIVIWSYTYSVSDIDIYGARFLANGTKQWSAGLIAPIAQQTAPSPVSDGAGGVIFSYVDNGSGLGLDVHAARFSGGGALQFDVSVRTVAGDQSGAVTATDDAGGAIVAYLDASSGTPHVYASRLTSTGAFAPGWVSVGTTVCGAAGGQLQLAIVPDDNHGAIIGWLDGRTLMDIFASHITAYGTLALGWITDGNAVTNALVSLKSGPAMARDGSGGAVMVWSDNRTGSTSVFGARLTGAGALAPIWSFNGTPIRVVLGTIGAPLIAADGGTAFGVVWRDDRTAPTQIYAQRVERFGVLGNPEPLITSIKDVIQDQGAKVRLAWNASWIDADPDYGVGAYWVWRQVPTTSALAAIAKGASWLSADEVSIVPQGAHGLYMAAPDAAMTGYSWEFLVSLPASGFPSYSYVAATTTDSMPAGNPRTAFMVQARGVAGGAFWSSNPDSGYSVDNLAPAMPAPFTGVYSSSSTALHWGKNLEPDLANYRLYRGGSAGFVPGPGNLVASPTDTGYVDPGGTPHCYKLSAVDVHGNESPFALLTPSGTVDVSTGAIPRVLALVPAPSPARGPMVMTVSLPERADVTLTIFDASGRRIVGLAGGPWEAGNHPIPWDGRDRSGREVSSGLYFARLEALGHTLHARFVRMK